MMDNEDIQEIIRRDFPAMKTQEDLLALLNEVKRFHDVNRNREHNPIRLKTLNFYKNIKVSGPKRYRTFHIKKKSGALRTINAPSKGLKLIQTQLNYIFQTLYDANENACGFVPGRSIADGARKHVGKKFVLNIDLKDFFDSVDFYRVKYLFTRPPFNLKEDKGDTNSVPYILANLCCHPKEVTRFDKEGNPYACVRNVTPQGAPTSPILTNFICGKLDRRLQGLAKRFRLSYSRYADDITFSSNRSKVFAKDSAFTTELRRIIEDQGFRINDDKTRVQSKAYRQEVTGLIVNSKLNVSKRYVKQIRMWLYLWEKYGYNRASNYFISDYCKSKGQAKHGTNMENVIGGKLNYLKMIVGPDNRCYIKLAERFEDLLCVDNPCVNVAAILDVWEKEGIEKAIEFYERINNNKK